MLENYRVNSNKFSVKVRQKFIEFILYQKKLTPEISSKQLECNFENHAQNFSPNFRWLSDRNLEACIGKCFLSETILIGFSSGHVSCSFDNHNSFWNVKTASAESQTKVKIQVLLAKNSSTEIFRHVESIFDNLAPTSSHTI